MTAPEMFGIGQGLIVMGLAALFSAIVLLAVGAWFWHEAGRNQAHG